MIDDLHRSPRVRFKHPIRVSSLEGAPRIVRTLTANLSYQGLFVRMPTPLPEGMKVALSLEAAGQALPFAEAEVVWCRLQASSLPGRYPGFGVRFQRFLHPRAEELVRYLVENLDRGKPLTLAPRPRRWKRTVIASGLAVAGMSALGALTAWSLGGGGPGAVPMVRAFAAPVVQAPALLVAGDRAAPSMTKAEVPNAAVEALAPAVPSVEGVPSPSAATGAAGSPELAAKVTPPQVDAAEAPELAQKVPPPAEAPPRAEEAPELAAKVTAPVEAAVARELTGKVQPSAEPPMVGEAAKVPPPAETVVAIPDEPVKPRAELLPPKANEKRGELVLPSGAARAVSWALVDRELRLAADAGGGTLRRAFVLEGPPRVVFDVDGSAPLKSLTLAGATPFIKQVRVGRQGDSSTRVVVDLVRAPTDISPDGDAFILSF